MRVAALLATACLHFRGISSLDLVNPKNMRAASNVLGRRNMLQTVAGSIAVGTLAELANPLQAMASESPNADKQFQTYRVIPDASSSLKPRIKSVQARSFLQDMSRSKGGALWLGEHHNSADDHVLQAEIIRKLYQSRKGQTSKPTMGIGLEQVQVQFQPVLDDFIAGKILASDMQRLVEWDKRWMWPFEVYEPVFTAAKELGIPLVALNVNTEDLQLVEKGGLPGLPRDRLQQYIPDATGFATFAKAKQFTTYVNYVIRPSYELHQAMGLLSYSITGEKMEEEMSFRNFYSGRILWDEAMASAAYTWTKTNPGGLLVGLVGADHVKFGKGIPGRFSRMIGKTGDSVSVMLNPTLIDTRPAGSVGNIAGSDSAAYPNLITLQLRYLKDDIGFDSPSQSLPSSTGGVLPLVDYLILSRTAVA